MGLRDDLKEEVATIFRSAWTERDGTVVPDETSVKLGNDGVNLDATVLYADLDGSTNLVDTNTKNFSAEIYKAYLLCAARIIRSENGAITAYDGDRVMAVYIGDYKNTSAVKTALKINWAVINIINPAIEKTYGSNRYKVKQVIGIDTSKLMAARIGIRNYNDLVWVGRSANYAAKLSALTSKPTFITKAVYDKINDEAKYSNGVDMWEPCNWTPMNDARIYRSEYSWRID
jgi:class 3 adenylate cyclase